MPLSRRQALGLGTGSLATLVAGCSAETLTSSAKPSPAQSPPGSLPSVRHEQSLPALMRQTFAAAAPERVSEVESTDTWTKHRVRYPSGGLEISGMLLVPRGEGPFPAVVLCHGYVQPGTYVSGQGMAREQGYLADRGFVVLHTDYRGHAASSAADPLERELALGYVVDALNAAQSVKQLPQVDAGKVAMFGHSMGGGVTNNALVVGPGIVRAGVAWGAVSSRFHETYRRLIVRKRTERAREIRQLHGRPTDDNTFFTDMSSRTFFDRIRASVLLDHGTADSTCPVSWSRDSADLMGQAGVDVRLHERRGEEHSYGDQWRAAMDDAYAFLQEKLDL